MNVLSRGSSVFFAAALLAGPVLAAPTEAEMNYVISQVHPGWLAIVAAQGVQPQAVDIALTIEQNGRVVTARLANSEDRYDSDAKFRISADAAVRAVLRASPLHVPPTHPEFFKNNPDLIVTFDPRSMR